MEIERKYLVKEPLANYQEYPCQHIQQGYLSTLPTVRVRKEDDQYYLTYKSTGHMVREEYNLPLTKEAYSHLVQKADGNILSKKRYLIPIPGGQGLVVQLDVFEGKFEGLVLAEVEFDTEEEALAFVPPSWLGEEVTFSPEYKNSWLSQLP